jgi:hypothetical protein
MKREQMQDCVQLLIKSYVRRLTHKQWLLDDSFSWRQGRLTGKGIIPDQTAIEGFRCLRACDVISRIISMARIRSTSLSSDLSSHASL